jgi:hypothetical protein
MYVPTEVDLAYDFYQFAYILVILVVLIGALVQQDQSALMIYFVRVIVLLTIFKELVSATFERYNSKLFLTVDFQSEKCVVRSYSRVESKIYSMQVQTCFEFSTILVTEFQACSLCSGQRPDELWVMLVPSAGAI